MHFRKQKGEISVEKLIGECEDILRSGPNFDDLGTGEKNGKLAKIRPFELIAAINRFELCEVKIIK